MLVVVGTRGLLLCSATPVVLMSVAFAGMLTCAGVAVWLWLRHRRLVGGQPPGERGAYRTTARAPVLAQEHTPVLGHAPASAPIPRGQPDHAAPEPPRVEPWPAERLPAASALTGPARSKPGSEPFDDPLVERTEFIPSPLALARARSRSDRPAPLAAPAQDDHTAFVAPLGVDPDVPGPATHRGYQPAAEAEVEDRTCFVAPAFDDPQG